MDTAYERKNPHAQNSLKYGSAFLHFWHLKLLVIEYLGVKGYTPEI